VKDVITGFDLDSLLHFLVAYAAILWEKWSSNRVGVLVHDLHMLLSDAVQKD
jgi:hypothetical protein